MPQQIDRIPMNHYAFCTEDEAVTVFRAIYHREPGDDEIKVVERSQPFGKMYFVECEQE